LSQGVFQWDTRTKEDVVCHEDDGDGCAECHIDAFIRVSPNG
jgi:hypothetical protein